MTFAVILTFAMIALGMVLIPGPNMLYLISRSIVQGKRAGLISLFGVATGFVVYMLLAAFGITAAAFQCAANIVGITATQRIGLHHNEQTQHIQCRSQGLSTFVSNSLAQSLVAAASLLS